MLCHRDNLSFPIGNCTSFSVHSVINSINWSRICIVSLRREGFMSEQGNLHPPISVRPATNDPEAWKAYWEAQGQSWRTEPEIDNERQSYLEHQRMIRPDVEKEIYPFKGIKLSRA